jgi:hypothetical protein
MRDMQGNDEGGGALQDSGLLRSTRSAYGRRYGLLHVASIAEAEIAGIRPLIIDMRIFNFFGGLRKKHKMSIRAKCTLAPLCADVLDVIAGFIVPESCLDYNEHIDMWRCAACRGCWFPEPHFWYHNQYDHCSCNPAAIADRHPALIRVRLSPLAMIKYSGLPAGKLKQRLATSWLGRKSRDPNWKHGFGDEWLGRRYFIHYWVPDARSERRFAPREGRKHGHLPEGVDYDTLILTEVMAPRGDRSPLGLIFMRWTRRWVQNLMGGPRP